jgi:hypothetical protein
MPQGLYNRAPIGSLLKQPKAITARRRNPFGRTARLVDDSHLEVIRKLPCIKCGMEPSGEAAHIRQSSATHGARNAMGRKPDDSRVLPCCRGCHQDDPDSLHKIGELTFFHDLNIDPLHVCERLYALSPDVDRMRAAVVAIAKERT